MILFVERTEKNRNKKVKNFSGRTVETRSQRLSEDEREKLEVRMRFGRDLERKEMGTGG